MKSQVETIRSEAEGGENNPICAVINSKKRGHLKLSIEDLEILRQLAQNSPPPTPELRKALLQAREEEVQSDKSVAP